jgi:hypothetical protein
MTKIPDINQVRQRILTESNRNPNTRAEKELKLINKRINKQLLSGKIMCRTDVPMGVVNESDIKKLLLDYSNSGYNVHYEQYEGDFYISVWA